MLQSICSWLAAAAAAAEAVHGCICAAPMQMQLMLMDPYRACAAGARTLVGVLVVRQAAAAGQTQAPACMRQVRADCQAADEYAVGNSSSVALHICTHSGCRQ